MQPMVKGHLWFNLLHFEVEEPEVRRRVEAVLGHTVR